MTQQRRRRLPFEVWALVAGGFTIALGYGVVAPVLPQFAVTFGVSNFAATAIISSFALTRLVFAPFAGIIVTRLGERSTYVTGLLIVAVMTGAAVFVTSYAQLLTTRAIAGIGSTMFTVAATALMIKVTPSSERGRVAGINSAGFMLGNLLGPVLGALVAGFGIRAPFAVYFITLLIAALVVWFALSRSQMAGAGAVSNLRPPRSLNEALGLRQYRSALFSSFSFGWATFGVRVSIVPLFVAAVLMGSESDAGWVLAAYAAGNAAFVLPSGRWNDRVGRKPMLVVGFGLSALAFLVLPFTSAVWAAAITLAFAGVGSAFANPAQQATLADIVGKRGGGQVVATTQMVTDLGAIIGPLAVGLIADQVGFEVALLSTAGLLAVAAIVWLFTPDSRVLAIGEVTEPIEVISPTEPTGPAGPSGPIDLPKP